MRTEIQFHRVILGKRILLERVVFYISSIGHDLIPFLRELSKCGNAEIELG